MPLTTKEMFDKLPLPNRSSSYAEERDRYGNIGTITQGRRKSGREDPQGEYLTKEGHSINATKVVKIYENENCGKFSLIATQCPLSHTLNSFFGLIYTSKIDAVVVLGQLEPGRLEDYWNPVLGRRSIMGYGHGAFGEGIYYELASEAKGSGSGYKIYKIVIKRYKGERLEGNKELVLFHYYAWPDKNTPTNKDDFEKFVRLFNVEDKRKLLVHCSAGVGRTGTFAACLQALKEKRRDPFEIVKSLREHRFWMVQTDRQFDLVCKFIARNCTDIVPKPDWDKELDYEKYFGKSESEVRR